MKGMTTMYDHKWKIWGVIISALGLAAMVAERLSPFVVFKKLNPVQHYGLFQWIMLAGLFLIIYCKEKYDDERAKAIRLKAFQISFALTQSVMLGIAFTGSLTKGLEQIDTSLLFVLGAFGILSYLLIFYVGLYFDFLWEYDDKGLWENLKNVNRNKWGILVYLVIGAIVMAAITLMSYP